MPGVSTFTQNFPNAGGGILGTFVNALPLNLGIPANVLNGVTGKYIVSITSRYDPSGLIATTKPRQSVTVYAYLQEKISMVVGSHWKDVGFSPSSIVEAGGGLLGGRSARSTVTSRRTWNGSDPVTITLKLRFEAFDDITTDVVQPIAQLQAMTLPRQGGDDGNSPWFLIPPGPNPFKFTLGGKEQGGEGDVITVRIGQFLTFSSVVVDDVSVEWDSKFGEKGPTGAGVIVKFSSYEMLTQQKLQDLYGEGIQVTGAELTPGKVTPVKAATTGGLTAGPLGAAANLVANLLG